MRIIITDFISLDGVVQAPGGPEEDTDGGFAHGGWSGPYFDPETMGAAIGEALSQTQALLFGRRTWEIMAAAWPGRAGDPFADQMNAIAKYVVSGTLTAADASSRWHNTTLLGGHGALDAVRELRAAGDGGIQVWGSASLARSLPRTDWWMSTA
jgi:dihydrofolate reductase